MRALVLLAVLFLAACSNSKSPDPINADCTVVVAGQRVVVNSGYQCSDPAKDTGGTGGDSGATF